MLRRVVSVVCFLLIAHTTTAIDKQVVCVNYKTPQGWSLGHKVKAVVAEGAELNDATMSTRYKGASTYVILLWDKEPARIIDIDLWAALSERGLTFPNKLKGNVIKLNSPFLTHEGQLGEDQQGRAWKVSTSMICA